MDIFILSFFRIALAIPVGEDGYSKCSMYDVNYTEVLSNGIREANPSWPTKGCSHGWEFNFTDIPYETVATEVKPILLCENVVVSNSYKN